jgi:hypothetical protein
MDNTKYVGMDVHRNGFDCCGRFHRKAGEGIHSRNKGEHNSRVYPGASQKRAGEISSES